MGVYAESDIYVTVPADKVADLATAIREWFATQKYYDLDYYKDCTDIELVGRVLPDTEGNESRVDEGYEVTEQGDVVISDGFYGKVSFDCDAIEDIYAEHGAVGVIDVSAEGEMWRARLKDGKAKRYTAEIVYPDDPEGER